MELLNINVARRQQVPKSVFDILCKISNIVAVCPYFMTPVTSLIFGAQSVFFCKKMFIYIKVLKIVFSLKLRNTPK